MPGTTEMTRRRFLGYFSTVGLSSTLLPGVLWTQVQAQEEPKVTLGMLEDAERVAGLSFTPEERELMLRGLNEYLESYEAVRAVELPNRVPLPLVFNPVPPGTVVQRADRPFRRSRTRVAAVPASRPASRRRSSQPPLLRRIRRAGSRPR